VTASTDLAAAALGVALLAACGADPRGSADTRRPIEARSGSASAATADPAAPAPKLPEACSGPHCFTSPAGFRFLHPLPAGHSLESVVAVRRGEALAVGADGTMLRLRPDGIERIEIPGLPNQSQLFGMYEDRSEGGQANASFALSHPRLLGIVRTGDDIFVLVSSEHIARFDGTRWSMENLAKGLSAGEEMIRAPDGSPLVLPSALEALRGDTNVLVREQGTWQKGPAVPERRALRTGISTKQDIWLGGDGGKIMVSRRRQDFVVDARLDNASSGVAALWLDDDGSRGLAVTSNGLMFERADGAWQREDPEVRGKISGGVDALWQPPESSTIWAVGDRIHRRTLQGKWTEVRLPQWARNPPAKLAEGSRFHAIAGTSYDDVWIVGNSGIVMYWDGKELREISSRKAEHDVIALLPQGDEDWLAVHYDGTILRSDGKAVVLEAKLDGPVNAAFRADDDEVVVQTYDRKLYARRGGDYKQYKTLPISFSAAAGPTAADFYAVGDKGEAWRVKLIGGATPINTGVTNDLRAIAFAAPNDIWIAGDDVILRGDGSTFNVAHKLDREDIRAIAVRSRDDVWFTGNSAIVLNWDGKQLRRFERVSSTELSDVVVDARGVWAAGGPDLAFFDGTKWSMIDSGATGLRRLLLRKNGVLMAAGQGGAIVSGPAFKGSR
jgi:hypothetical protein